MRSIPDELEARALVIRDLLREGWSPPKPDARIVLAIAEDMERITAYRATLELSPSELAMLTNLADGYMPYEAAHRVGLSPQTMKGHAKRLYRRLGARNAAHAVAIGFRNDLLT